MYLFQQINQAAKSVSFSDTQEAQAWYRDQAMNINKDQVNQEQIMETADPFKIFKNVGVPQIGKMFMFVYDPKFKTTLPFYDMFPLVFPLDFSTSGFLAINLHYLPPQARAGLMNALHTIANNDKYNNSTKLNISYNVLKQSSTKFSGFENCVKRYLYGHVKSAFQYVNPKDWDKALLLPMQMWKINPDRRYSSKASPPY
jgi:hypothetical protein